MSKQTYTTGQVLTSAQMTTLQQNDFNQTVSAKVASYVLVASDAGTRITMSNVAATTITVNSSLFSAGDTLLITNIGAGATVITPGTATVSTSGSLTLSQYESGTLYFTSAGVSIFFGSNPGDITGVTAGTGISGGGTSGTVTITNSMATEITAAGDIVVGTGSGTFDNLPIGTTAQVLTADTTVSPYKVKWATASSGLTQTASSTFTAASAVNINNCFSATYKRYRVLVKVIAATGGDRMSLKMRVGGVDASTSYFAALWQLPYGGGAGTNVNTNNGTLLPLAYVSTLYTCGVAMDILAPFQATQTTITSGVFSPQVVGASENGSGMHLTATSYDGFSLTFPSGTYTGEVVVYGYQD